MVGQSNDGSEGRVNLLATGSRLPKNSVKDTATAASLWAPGAIGVASSLGSYDVAVVLTLFVLITLWVMAPLKSSTNERVDAAE